MDTMSVCHVVNRTAGIHTIGSVLLPSLSQRPRGYCTVELSRLGRTVSSEEPHVTPSLQDINDSTKMQMANRSPRLELSSMLSPWSPIPQLAHYPPKTHDESTNVLLTQDAFIPGVLEVDMNAVCGSRALPSLYTSSWSVRTAVVSYTSVGRDTEGDATYLRHTMRENSMNSPRESFVTILSDACRCSHLTMMSRRCTP